MPYKSKKVKAEKKDRYRTKVGSVCGSEKLIPNCPLQGKKEFIGIYGTLRRTRTYPEYSGRVGANGSGPKEKGLTRSASMNWPQFWPQKLAKPIPVIGCQQCTPWVVCQEHSDWMTLRIHSNYETPKLATNKEMIASETPYELVTPTSKVETPASSKVGRKKIEAKGRGRPKKSINDTPKESFEEFEKRVNDSMKELELNTPLCTPKTSRKRHTEMDETPKSKKGKKPPVNNIPKKDIQAKTDEIKCITLSSDEDEPMEIQKEKTLTNRDENDSITLSSDEKMEVDVLPEVTSTKPAIFIDFEDENLLIDFATTRNTGANIWRRAQLPLYQQDAYINN